MPTPSPIDVNATLSPTPSVSSQFESVTATVAAQDVMLGNDEETTKTPATVGSDGELPVDGTATSSTTPAETTEMPQTTMSVDTGDEADTKSSSTTTPAEDTTTESTEEATSTTSASAANTTVDGNAGLETTAIPTVLENNTDIDAGGKSYVDEVATDAPTPNPIAVGDDGRWGDGPNDNGGLPTPFPSADGGDEGSWGDEWSKIYPTKSPTPRPTYAYHPKSDDPLNDEDMDIGEFDDDKKSANLQHEIANYMEGVESPQEMETDKNVQVVAGSLTAVFILLWLLTAHQTMENPDGICAGFCRLILKLITCIVRVLCLPCRFLCCKGSDQTRSRRTHAPMRAPFPNDLELA
eukprot:g12039.t1 g12039   contig6:1095057-1096237(+)